MTKRWMRVLVVAAVGVSLLLPGGVARADSWQDRVWAGSNFAGSRGTTVAIAMLDQRTGEYRNNGAAATTRIESASVMKVFIAEHLLNRRDRGQIRLSATDMNDMAAMLRDSANAPANRFWSTYGANGIVQDVINRYGLTQTGLTSNPRYWGNTLITAHDMVVFYRRLMDGSGGLSAGSRDWIVDQMRQSTMYGDGGRQFFGLHDGLPREGAIAQKQGWMCCVNGDIFRHSSGFVGHVNRYILVVLSREPSSRGGAHIEESISGAVRAMFPEGLIPRVQGAIGEHWYGMGGASGRLGYPTSDEIGLAGGALSRFQGGFIYWSPATGARSVWGAILDAYAAQRWELGPLGYPTSDEIVLPGGALSRFQGGFIYWSPATGAHSVREPILAAYGAQRWENGPLGYPTSSTIALRDNGSLNRFQGGYVYASPATGAHSVREPILAAYGAQRWENGPLGYPTSSTIVLRDDGSLNRFQGGYVYASPATGAHSVRQPILAAYGAQRWENGPLGYPTSSTIALRDDGSLNRFQGGYVYASPATGAHTVSGRILTAYGAQRWENGPLGYPTSGTYAVPEGTRQDFEGGMLTLPSDGSPVVTGPLETEPPTEPDPPADPTPTTSAARTTTPAAPTTTPAAPTTTPAVPTSSAPTTSASPTSSRGDQQP
ncbi:hypothetical protein DQ244_10600 [Blastococcus sp. TBT05-19]|uniref:serine hydrolase n=1 Tax=Blastococcus sp. TBT05-19 TaxID=2250581 RepID=UPI000DE9E55E|nr:serine hydrolase [Blastococcus sp. TBT05-19]RBY91729.1 hypothetical protein DQ244_10600 [Blastococcus sp. TBT05-19]